MRINTLEQRKIFEEFANALTKEQQLTLINWGGELYLEGMVKGAKVTLISVGAGMAAVKIYKQIKAKKESEEVEG